MSDLGDTQSPELAYSSMFIWERELIRRNRRLYGLPIAFVVGPLSAPGEFDRIHKLVRMASVIIELSTKYNVRCANQTRFNMLVNPPPRDPGDLDTKFEIFYKEIIRLCDIVLVMPGHERSSGCQKEIEYAREMGKPIYFLSLDQLKRVHTMRSYLEKNWPISDSKLAELLDFGGELRCDRRIEFDHIPDQERTKILRRRIDWRNIVTTPL